jgi:hypothetical protein
MKKLIGLAVVQLLVLSLPAVAQDSDPPPGASKVGSTWCVFVNGEMRRFLDEVTRLVDAGAEVQGGVEYRQTTGTYTALVCKRGGGPLK